MKASGTSSFQETHAENTDSCVGSHLKELHFPAKDIPPPGLDAILPENHNSLDRTLGLQIV